MVHQSGYQKTRIVEKVILSAWIQQKKFWEIIRQFIYDFLQKYETTRGFLHEGKNPGRLSVSEK